MVLLRRQNRDHDGYIDPNAADSLSGIGLAIMRLDGFVSADADYSGGELTTRLLSFEGDKLEVNVDTGGGGVLQVEVLDEAGTPIPATRKPRLRFCVATRSACRSPGEIKILFNPSPEDQCGCASSCATASSTHLGLWSK